MRKTKKHKVFSIQEKNKLVLLYLDRHQGATQIMRENGIKHKQMFYDWISQYREFGTCVDRRGKASKKDGVQKGRTRKYKVNLEDLSKEQLIEKIKMYEDIKKSMAYLIEEQQN